jgi:hypothetical protein
MTSGRQINMSMLGSCSRVYRYVISLDVLSNLPNDFTNTASSLQSTLDGKPIDFARVQYPPGGFGVRVTANNALFGDLTSLFEGTVSLHAVVDGYWSLLSKPIYSRACSYLWRVCHRSYI